MFFSSIFGFVNFVELWFYPYFLFGKTTLLVPEIYLMCAIDPFWDSPPIYDDYPEDFSQGEKIEPDKNKVIYIRDEPITHIIYETFDIQKQKVIDPFWEDFVEQELIEVNKRRERVILSNLCQ